MSTAEKPGQTVPLADLTNASLPAVLLYGLTVDDEDPALGVLLGVRSELNLIASLVERTQPGTDFDFTEVAPVLEGLVRRLDVAIELMARAKRTRTVGEPLAHEETRGST